MQIPSGMLAPSGLRQTPVDPAVQSTTRPPGSLLAPSPGFDSVRPGKNIFQGKGPTGGFRPLEFAEDIGGSGAALSVVPGDVSQIEASEWLPDAESDIEPGSMIVADRGDKRRAAFRLHEGHYTMPDMGDRSPGRPLTRALMNPYSMLRKDYQENRAVTLVLAAGGIMLAWMVGNDLERSYRSRRGRGVASEATAAPASAAETTGGEIDKATKIIGDAIEDGVAKIDEVIKSGISAVEDAGSAAGKAGKATGDAVQE